MYKKILYLLFFFTIANTVFSQNIIFKERSITRVLIVGISRYQYIKNLEYADVDAEKVYSYFNKLNESSHDSVSIRLLKNEKATAANIYQGLNWLVEESKMDDKAIIYFSGHGDVETKTIAQMGYLLAYDCSKDVYDAGGTININRLQDYVNSLTANNVKTILIADACRAGKISGNKDGVKLTTAALSAKWTNETKILSSRPGELSYEDKIWNGGAFTYYLLLGLNGLADYSIYGGNNDNVVSAMELNFFLFKNVPKVTRERQHPLFVGDDMLVLSMPDSLQYSSVEKFYQTGNLALSSGKGEINPEDLYLKFVPKKFKLQYKELNRLITKGYLIHNPKKGGRIAINIYENLENFLPTVVINHIRRILVSTLQRKSQKEINEYIIENDIHFENSFKLVTDELAFCLSIIDSTNFQYNDIKGKYLFIKGLANKKDSTDKSIQFFKKGLHFTPFASHIYNEIGALYKKKNVLDSSEYYFSKAIEYSPFWAIPYYNRGNLYLRNKNYEKAIQDFSKAIRFNPKAPDFYYNRGDAYYYLNDLYKSSLDFTKALKLDSNYFKAYNARGINYKKNKNYDLAISDFNSAISIRPNYRNALINRANIYRKQEKYKQAIKDYSTVLKTNSNDIKALKYRGRCFIKVGDIQSAIHDFNIILLINPKKKDVYFDLINIYSNTINNNKELLLIYEKYLANCAFNPEINFKYALLLSIEGKKKKSLKQIKKGIAEGKKDILNYIFAAKYFAFSNNRRKTIKYLKKAKKVGWHNFSFIEEDFYFKKIVKDKKFNKSLERIID